MAHPAFQLRPVGTVDERTDMVLLHLVRAAVPVIPPSEEDVDEVLELLGMNRHEMRCSYCGNRPMYWEHFRPLVSGREVTGFITEIQNLVPSCAACDKSKAGSHWKKW